MTQEEFQNKTRRELMLGLSAVGIAALTGCDGARSWREGSEGRGAAPPIDTGLLDTSWGDSGIEEVSDCCGADVYDDYDICSNCNDHCGREESEQ